LKQVELYVFEIPKSSEATDESTSFATVVREILDALNSAGMQDDAK